MRMPRGSLPYGRGSSQRRSFTARTAMGRSGHLTPLCYNCGEEGNTSGGCPKYGACGGVFQGKCLYYGDTK